MIQKHFSKIGKDLKKQKVFLFKISNLDFEKYTPLFYKHEWWNLAYTLDLRSSARTGLRVRDPPRV